MQSCCIDVKLDSRELLDSGATINLISEKCFRESNTFAQSKIKSEFSQAVIANGTCLTIVGVADIPLTIAGFVFHIPMYITSNLDRELILGTEVLVDQNATMNFGSNKLKL